MATYIHSCIYALIERVHPSACSHFYIYLNQWSWVFSNYSSMYPMKWSLPSLMKGMISPSITDVLFVWAKVNMLPLPPLDMWLLCTSLLTPLKGHKSNEYSYPMSMNLIVLTRPKSILLPHYCVYVAPVYTVLGPMGPEIEVTKCIHIIKVTKGLVVGSRFWDLRNASTPVSVAVGHTQAVKRIKVSWCEFAVASRMSNREKSVLARGDMACWMNEQPLHSCLFYFILLLTDFCGSFWSTPLSFSLYSSIHMTMRQLHPCHTTSLPGGDNSCSNCSPHMQYATSYRPCKCNLTNCTPPPGCGLSTEHYYKPCYITMSSCMGWISTCISLGRWVVCSGTCHGVPHKWEATCKICTMFNSLYCIIMSISYVIHLGAFVWYIQ